MESRTQRSRPKTRKKSKAKDRVFEDRSSRGQGQKCSRPRPRTEDKIFLIMVGKFFKLLAATFLFFSENVLAIIAFHKIFNDNLKPVVSKNNKCYVKVLSFSSNADYVL